MPTNTPSSNTTTEPISSKAIIEAASAIVWFASAVTTTEEQAARTFTAGSAFPFRGRTESRGARSRVACVVVTTVEQIADQHEGGREALDGQHDHQHGDQ